MIPFYKYQGTGNDFVLVDQWKNQYLPQNNTSALIQSICDRRFGAGADGLIVIESHPHADFQMTYYNSDGRESTMCGNGGRCAVALAHRLGYVADNCHFEAVDGPHHAAILHDGRISLGMIVTQSVEAFRNDLLLNTGSPHYVKFVPNVQAVNVNQEGARIRYSESFAKAGINVNFVEKRGPHHLCVATYERGVEQQTLSCGTGVTAAAIAAYYNQVGEHRVKLDTAGGVLEVHFTITESLKIRNVRLIGPATLVYVGRWCSSKM